jgi:hypothetical protein
MDCDDVNRSKCVGQNPVISLHVSCGSYKSSSSLTTVTVVMNLEVP